MRLTSLLGASSDTRPGSAFCRQNSTEPPFLAERMVEDSRPTALVQWSTTSAPPLLDCRTNDNTSAEFRAFLCKRNDVVLAI
jgi:hypothetical protein